MSAAAAPARRGSRSAARAAAAGSSGAEPAADPLVVVATEQPRKRPRRAAAAAAAAILEAEGSTDGDTASPAADAGTATAAPQRKGPGRPKQAKLPSTASREFEEELWAQGYKLVAGVDEAGRGPLAGPVVAAACVVPPHVSIVGIDDSKKLSAEQREALYEQLTGHPDILWAAQVVDAGEIDTINILQAALKAMEGAAGALAQRPDFVLVDGNRLPKGLDPERSRTLVKGDSRCFCIAAASVIAKVTRDRIMEQYHEQWPQYNFAGHKGYCVPEHVEAVRKHGPCPVHRRTFAPIKHWFPLEPADGDDDGGKKAGKGAKKAAAAAGQEAGGGAAKGGRGSRRAGKAAA
ncbi:ribonuclease HII [Micractinium conductrix]|uniref:Ribonuclease n=1 Tax=Micractinium conductrix TaxID=554055 RepID=A0A2P6V851_9CHLO|nr:ribonuclease HII [Micractinium conductrix]|eukprot:PSC70258.1 ribonuclease HII [Micractinium conductrix]